MNVADIQYIVSVEGRTVGTGTRTFTPEEAKNDIKVNSRRTALIWQGQKDWAAVAREFVRLGP